MNLLLRYSATAALCIALAGCALKDTARRPALPSPAEIVFRIQSRKHPSAFRSLVLVDVGFSQEDDQGSPLRDIAPEGGDSYAGKAVLLWKAPNSLRVEFLSPFGSPLFVVVANGEEFRAYSVVKNRFFIGRADSETMARWLGLPISPTLMLRILQGRMPALSGEADSFVRAGWGETGELRLEVPPGAGLNRRQTVLLDPDNMDPRRVTIGEEGAAIEIRYGSFMRAGGARRPTWAEVKDLRRGRRVRIQMDKGGRQVKTLPDTLFRLEAPSGARVIPLFGGGGG